MNLDLYLCVREKEGRLYSDAVVALLPAFEIGHALADEWRIRSASASNLIRYLACQPKPLAILDLGCGNGWFSKRLYDSGHHVTGMDQNLYELKQAARVFSQKRNLHFLQADIFSAPFTAESFDVILLASAIQYFPDLSALFLVLMKRLKPHGEIHIMDSLFYSEAEVNDAARRTHDYYASIGFPEMTKHYFHHRWSELDKFHPKILYRPQPLTSRLKRWLGQVDSPFPWIMLGKQAG